MITYILFLIYTAILLSINVPTVDKTILYSPNTIKSSSIASYSHEQTNNVKTVESVIKLMEVEWVQQLIDIEHPTPSGCGPNNNHQSCLNTKDDLPNYLKIDDKWFYKETEYEKTTMNELKFGDERGHIFHRSSPQHPPSKHITTASYIWDWENGKLDLINARNCNGGEMHYMFSKYLY